MTLRISDYSDEETEYSFNMNGAMTQDLNKGIENIEYNYLNLPQEIVINQTGAQGKAYYTYSATGQKLRVIREHASVLREIPVTGLSAMDVNQTDSVDYVGNFIYENDSLKRILVVGGYIEDGNYYFYITDHLGNNRIVADASGDVVQSNEYYPFGLLMATSTNADKQPYKYGNKELDSYNGLNWYDFEARYLDSGVPGFTTQDPLAEKYYSISPYVYVGNNPIIRTDPTGMDWVHRVVNGIQEIYYDRTIRSQDDIYNKYGENSGISYIANGTSYSLYDKEGNEVSKYQFWNDASENNEYGAVTDANGNLYADDQIIQGNNYTIFGTSDNSVNPETLHSNLMGTSYTGSDNPKDYLGSDSYQYMPRNRSEYGSMIHDIFYDKGGAAGIKGALFNTNVRNADKILYQYNAVNAVAPGTPFKDRMRSVGTAILFRSIYEIKTTKHLFQKK